MIKRIVPLEELLDDWVAQTKWGSQPIKIAYLNKLKELNVHVQTEGTSIIPYKTEEGVYDYETRFKK